MTYYVPQEVSELVDAEGEHIGFYVPVYTSKEEAELMHPEATIQIWNDDMVNPRDN